MAQRWHRKGRANQQRTRRACVARLGSEGRRRRRKRTRNMLFMVVTLEVFQFDMSALKFFKFWKSQLMSVIFETSHSATGPYVAVAAVGLALNAWTAVIRAALLVNLAVVSSLLNAVTAAFSEVLSVKTFAPRRRRRRVGGAGGLVASSTGSQCGGQATPFSVSPRLTRKHHQV